MFEWWFKLNFEKSYLIVINRKIKIISLKSYRYKNLYISNKESYRYIKLRFTKNKIVSLTTMVQKPAICTTVWETRPTATVWYQGCKGHSICSHGVCNPIFCGICKIFSNYSCFEIVKELHTYCYSGSGLKKHFLISLFMKLYKYNYVKSFVFYGPCECSL